MLNPHAKFHQNWWSGSWVKKVPDTEGYSFIIIRMQMYVLIQCTPKTKITIIVWRLVRSKLKHLIFHLLLENVTMRKLNFTKKVDLSCKIVQVTLTIAFLAISITISKEVWEQYASKATSFKQSETDITDLISVTLVFGLFLPLKHSDYHKDLPLQSYKQWILDEDFKGKFFSKVKLNQNIWQLYWALLKCDTDILI